MRTISLRAWLLVAVSALLQVLLFPVAGPALTWLAFLSWIALVPFLFALLSTAKDQSSLGLLPSALLGYCCGVLFYAGNCYWIYQTMYLYGGLPKPIAFVILILFALYLGLYHALFAFLFSVVRRGKWGSAGALAAAPFLWVAVELARARVTGFPWDLLGYAQVNNLLITRLAPLGGVMSISFLLSACSAVLTYALLRRRARGWMVTVAACLVVLVLQLGGSLPYFNRADRPAENQTVVMMQENLAVGATGRAVRPLTQQEEFTAFNTASLNPLMHPAQDWTEGTTKVSLLVWPEAPSHFQSNDPAFRQQIASLAQRLHAPVIAGSLGVDVTSTVDRGYFLYDSASLFAPDGLYAGRYDKIHLVPWGEYVPFKQFFSFAQKLTEGVGDMDRGQARNLFLTGGRKYGVFICYESIFGDEVREFAHNGAEVLVNISDDGWYGDTGAPWQHLNMARMRAIENHRYLLRATNTGVTTVIDARGRVRVEAPRHVRAAFAFPFAFEQGETLYTRYGDWFAWVCVIVSGAFILGAAGFRDPTHRDTAAMHGAPQMMGRDGLN